MFGSKKRRERKKEQRKIQNNSFRELEAIAGNYAILYKALVGLFMVGMGLIALNELFGIDNDGLIWGGVSLLFICITVLFIFLYFQVRKHKKHDNKSPINNNIDITDSLANVHEIEQLKKIMTPKEQAEYFGNGGSQSTTIKNKD